MDSEDKCFVCKEETAYRDPEACKHTMKDLLKVGNNLVAQINQMHIEMKAMASDTAQAKCDTELKVRRNGKLREALERLEIEHKVTRASCGLCSYGAPKHASTCQFKILTEKV